MFATCSTVFSVQQHHHGILGSAQKVGFAQRSDDAIGVLDDTAVAVSTAGVMPKFANFIDSHC